MDLKTRAWQGKCEMQLKSLLGLPCSATVEQVLAECFGHCLPRETVELYRDRIAVDARGWEKGHVPSYVRVRLGFFGLVTMSGNKRTHPEVA